MQNYYCSPDYFIKLRGRACAIPDVILHINLCICVTGKLSLCWLFHWAVHQLQNEFNKCVHLCTNWKADAVFEMLWYTAWVYTSLLKKNKHKYDRFSCETANLSGRSHCHYLWLETQRQHCYPPTPPHVSLLKMLHVSEMLVARNPLF